MRKSILAKIILSFLAVLFIPTTAISVSTYFISTKMLEEKVSDSFLTNLTFISANIEKELEQWDNISKYIVANPVIRDILNKPYQTDAEFYTDVKLVDKEIDSYSINTNIIAYISSLVVFGANGRNLLYGEDVSTLQLSQIKKQSWFRHMYHSDEQMVWLGTQKNYADYRVHNENVIGLTRLVKGDRKYENLGVLYLAFRPQYFLDLLGNVNMQPGSRLYVVDNNDRIVYDSDQELTNETYPKMTTIRKHADQHYVVERAENGEKMLMAYTPIDGYGWWTIETVTYESLMAGKQTIFRNTLFVFLLSFVLTAILWYFISSAIVQPIKGLTRTMKKVQDGDLHARFKVTRSDEFGQLGHHFNSMIDRLQELFHSNLQEQEKKKEAEYRALQSQINPHFLYNTLNTIRWMAIIQKAGPIQEVIEVLGRLLKGIFKSDAPFITIEEEISNLKDYIYIQKLRYNNKFSVRYEIDPEVENEPCMKFILQPIVENSIFHGIQPKETSGEVVISAKQERGRIVIGIWDDGVGMSEEELEKLRNNMAESGGIGIGNVAERLKLTYGEEYGLTIDSEKNVFTKIEIVYPASRAEVG